MKFNMQMPTRNYARSHTVFLLHYVQCKRHHRNFPERKPSRNTFDGIIYNKFTSRIMFRSPFFSLPWFRFARPILRFNVTSAPTMWAEKKRSQSFRAAGFSRFDSSLLGSVSRRCATFWTFFFSYHTCIATTCCAHCSALPPTLLLLISLIGCTHVPMQKQWRGGERVGVNQSLSYQVRLCAPWQSIVGSWIIQKSTEANHKSTRALHRQFTVMDLCMKI